MDRVKKFTGMSKGTPVVPVRRDEDENLVLFGELYKHEKERDMNLLEPMFSVEFEAIQGEGLLLFSHSPVLVNRKCHPFCFCYHHCLGSRASRKEFMHSHLIFTKQ
jgi:hypothetical protein